MRKTVDCGNKIMSNSEQKETRQLMSHQVTYALLHLLILSMELCAMPFLEAIFRCREMNVHIALRCSAPSETIGMLFPFPIANFNGSILLPKTHECILINLMSSHNFSYQQYLMNVHFIHFHFQKRSNLHPVTQQ